MTFPPSSMLSFGHISRKQANLLESVMHSTVKFVLFVCLGLFLDVYAQSSVDCLPSNDRNKCSFYAQCLERKYDCQQTEYRYPIEYGDRFCRAFDDSRSQFSPMGQKWIDRTMRCLQRTLQQQLSLIDILALTDNNLSCRRLEQVAFASHHLCYVKPTGNLQDGVCPLWRDYKIIFETGRPWDARGTDNERAVKEQVKQTAKTCINYWLTVKRQKSASLDIPIETIIQTLQSFIQEGR